MTREDEKLKSNIENLKQTVKQSFCRIYAALKARELQTLRQLDAIHRQCQQDENLLKKCVHNVQVSYENESELLENINNYATLDLEKLNFDNNIFLLEDYISPNDDHLYSYKCIEDLTKDVESLEDIEVAALKQVTNPGNCVCFVSVRKEEACKQFSDEAMNQRSETCVISNTEEDSSCQPISEFISDFISDGEMCDNSEDLKKVDPTDDWLNSIKSQMETEPTQSIDLMEQSTIS